MRRAGRTREAGHEEPEEVVDGASLSDAAEEPVEGLHGEHATHPLAQCVTHRHLQTVEVVTLHDERKNRSLKTLAVVTCSAQTS